MKKTIIALLLSLFVVTTFVHAQSCTDTVYIHRPSTSTTYLLNSFSGRNSDVALIYGQIKQGRVGQNFAHIPWVDIQHMPVNDPCMGFTYGNQIALSTLTTGDVVMFRGVIIIPNVDTLITKRVRYVMKCHREQQSETFSTEEKNSSQEYLFSGAFEPQTEDADYFEEEQPLEDIPAPFNDIRIYASGQRLSFSNHESVDFKFELIDMQGKKLGSGHISNGDVSVIEYLDRAPGMYLVHCTEISTGRESTQKVVFTR